MLVLLRLTTVPMYLTSELRASPLVLLSAVRPSTLRGEDAPVFGGRNEPERLERAALVEAADIVLENPVCRRQEPDSSAAASRHATASASEQIKIN